MEPEDWEKVIVLVGGLVLFVVMYKVLQMFLNRCRMEGRMDAGSDYGDVIEPSMHRLAPKNPPDAPEVEACGRPHCSHGVPGRPIMDGGRANAGDATA